ncbi:MAG: tyrosinase family protein [Burkholderiales bacterium]|jgi:hypothetical protein|uniref:tyrosinase family protein n=1 Tax=Limnobacter sp. TaxID=2003368 RepID=UPI0039478D75|nr:tyrosinase family protein [Burkholderiales bacterium]
MKAMRALPCDNPLSWYYQGAIHYVPDEVQNKNPLCPSYTQRSQLKPAWDTCTHADGSEIHFLIWHRLYIWHFEKIIRKISGKADFALPYWNYTNPRNRKLPPQFIDKNSSLYTESRLSDLNKHKKIASAMNPSLDIGPLFKNRVFSVFSSSIDNAPHGAMHWYVGGGFSNKPVFNPIYQVSSPEMFGLMSHVPSAGFDPVFWLHHSNIDLIWTSWEKTDFGVRPTLQQLEAVQWPYIFFDENGNKVQYTIKEAYEKAFNLDYSYDSTLSPVPNLKNSALVHEEMVLKSVSHNRELVWKKEAQVNLSKGNVKLKPGKAASDKLQLFSVQAPDALVLEIETSFKKQPKDAYNVYLLRKGKKTLLGVMTFFGAQHHHHSTHEHSRVFSFDVTDDIQKNDDYEILIEEQNGKGRGDGVSVTSTSLVRY